MTVVDTRKDDVLIVQAKNREYRYRTEQLFPIGTRLRITAKVQTETPSLRTKKQTLPPFITGEMDRPQRLRMKGLHGTITPQNIIRQGNVDLPRYSDTKARLINRV